MAIAGVDVHDLADHFGTPVFVLDEADFRRRCREFRAAFPDAKIFYAGKAFLCRAVAAMAQEEGLGLDVCSAGELGTALAAGVSPERIAFHGNNKSIDELERAVSVGVGTIIIDSAEEIERLSTIARDLGMRARTMVRVAPGVEAHTHEFVATAHDDQKFGFSLRTGAAEAAVRTVLQSRSLELSGLHCHVGSQIFDTVGFELAIVRLLELHARLGGGAWPELNIGGGFGIAYTAEDDPTPLRDIGAHLTRTVARECAALGIPAPRLVIEPGRAIVGPAMLTLYRVGTVKNLPGLRMYVSVDGGMSDNIRTALYGATYAAVLAGRVSDAHEVPARLVGKHCEAGDIVVRDLTLPSDIRAGDLVAVAATGAYGRSMASNYNHTPRPPVVAVADGTARVIVRRETEADLLALDVGL